MNEVVIGFLIMGFLCWLGDYVKPIGRVRDGILFCGLAFWGSIFAVIFSIILLPFAIIYKCLKD